MAQSAVPLDPNMPKEVRAFLDGVDRNLTQTRASIPTTPAEVGAAGTSQVEEWSGIIALPTDKDYKIVPKVPFGCTFNKITTQLASGTCTVALKIGSTAVTGGQISSTSSVQSSTCTANNVAAEDDAIVLTISSASAPVDLSFTVKYTRVLES